MAEAGTLPWPRELPEFVGMKLIDKVGDPKWGTGLEVRRQQITDFEKHPNSKLFPDLARAKFKGELAQVPKDASPEAKASVGTYYTQMRYFRIDTRYKCLKLLGAVDLPQLTTDPNALPWNNAPLSEDAYGGWRWHYIDALDLQFELNDNNTVLRSCNFKDKRVVATGDISANMSFFLARETWESSGGLIGSSVCPGFHPAPSDRTIGWHSEMQQLFHEENIFRSTQQLGPTPVMFTARFTEIREVDTVKERFGGSAEVTFSWPLSRLDAADWVAATDRAAWVPTSFVPPFFDVANKATAGGAEMVQTHFGRCRLRVREDHHVVATKRLMFRGDFYEPFELEAYPFDAQPLKMVLRTSSLLRSECTFENVGEGKFGKSELKPRDTEWRFQSTNSGCHFIAETQDDMELAVGLSNAVVEAPRPDSPESRKSSNNHLLTPSGSIQHQHSRASPDKRSTMAVFGHTFSPATRRGEDTAVPFPDGEDNRIRKRGSSDLEPWFEDSVGMFELTAEVVVERLYQVHLLRVVLVMALFSLTSITALVEDDDSNATDRLSLLVALMLTSATYSLVVADQIPALGYLTIVDGYVLGTFSFIGLVTLQVTVMEWVYPDGDGVADDNSSYDNGNDVMNMAAIVNLGAWLLINLLFFLHISCRVIPSERRKTDILHVAQNAGEGPQRTSARFMQNTVSPKQSALWGGGVPGTQGQGISGLGQRARPRPSARSASDVARMRSESPRQIDSLFGNEEHGPLKFSTVARSVGKFMAHAEHTTGPKATAPLLRSTAEKRIRQPHPRQLPSVAGHLPSQPVSSRPASSRLTSVVFPTVPPNAFRMRPKPEVSISEE